MNLITFLFSNRVKTIKLLLSLLSLSLIVACSETPHDLPKMDEYIYLRRQLTPDKRHYIYSYSREGAFVTSDEITGARLMKLNEPFRENGGIDVGGMLSSWSSMDTLTIHKSDAKYGQPKDTDIIRVDYQNYDGLVIKRIFEQPYVGGGLAGCFKFDSLRVVGNEITFFGAKDTLFTEKPVKKMMTFPIGSLIVSTNRDFITEIELSEQYKSMNFTRINDAGRRLYNQPEVGVEDYEFFPKKKIAIRKLKAVGYCLDYAINKRP